MIHKEAALRGLAANPALPPRLLDRLIAVADPELCLDLADRNDLTPAQARRLAARGGTDTTIHLVRRRLLAAADLDSPDPPVVLALLDETGAPESWARALCAHPDPAVRAGLAAAAHVPAAMLARLAEDLEVEVAAAVAGSARLTGELAHRLAGHPHLTVRRAVAGNERTPSPVLAALAAGGAAPAARWCPGCDGSDAPPGWMRCDGGHETALIDLAYAMVTNPATPADAVAGYAAHATAYVRSAVADRIDLSPHSYDTLAADPLPGVRGAVAANRAIGEHLIRALAGDGSNDVRRRLAHNPALPLDVLALIAPVTKVGTALLPRVAAATPDEIGTLARSPVPALRMLLAERPGLPPAVVNLLAEDPDAKVLKSLAHHAGLTEAQLQAVVARHGARVAAAAARNPACGPRLLHDLAAHLPPVQKALRIVAAHPRADAAALLLCLGDRQARPIAAGHPALPAAAIIRLLYDSDERVVEAAAANPSLPRSRMEDLITAEPEAGA